LTAQRGAAAGNVTHHRHVIYLRSCASAAQPRAARSGQIGLRPGASSKNPQRLGHNLLNRLRDYKDAVAFHGRLHRPVHQSSGRAGHPHDEGEDENLRRLPLPQGAETFATLRSALSTARQHGWTILDALTATRNNWSSTCQGKTAEGARCQSRGTGRRHKGSCRLRRKKQKDSYSHALAAKKGGTDNQTKPVKSATRCLHRRSKKN
jgi:hypothetical protein